MILKNRSESTPQTKELNLWATVLIYVLSSAPEQPRNVVYCLVSLYPSVPLRAIIYIKYDVKASVVPVAAGKSPFSPARPSFVLKHAGEEQETLSRPPIQAHPQ